MQSIKSFSIAKGIYCDVFYKDGDYYANIIQCSKVMCIFGPNKNKQSVIKEAVQAFNFIDWYLISLTLSFLF